MKKIIYASILSIFLTGTMFAQAETSTPEEEKKEEKEIEKEPEKDAGDTKGTTTPDWYRRPVEIKNPFEPKSTPTTPMSGVAKVNLKNGVEFIEPLSGFALYEGKNAKGDVDAILIAPEEFKPNKQQGNLKVEVKTATYIVYSWCSCKEVEKKCGCKTKKVVRLIVESKNNKRKL